MVIKLSMKVLQGGKRSDNCFSTPHIHLHTHTQNNLHVRGCVSVCLCRREERKKESTQTIRQRSLGLENGSMREGKRERREEMKQRQKEKKEKQCESQSKLCLNLSFRPWERKTSLENDDIGHKRLFNTVKLRSTVSNRALNPVAHTGASNRQKRFWRVDVSKDRFS